MTRVFVSEYLCGGAAPGRHRAAAFHAEGRAMLLAALADFARCHGVFPVTVADPALAPYLPQAVELHPADGPAEEARAFREQARNADVSLVIAPEFDGLLEQRCRRVEEAGGRLLG